MWKYRRKRTFDQTVDACIQRHIFNTKRCKQRGRVVINRRSARHVLQRKGAHDEEYTIAHALAGELRDDALEHGPRAGAIPPCDFHFIGQTASNQVKVFLDIYSNVSAVPCSSRGSNLRSVLTIVCRW